MNGGEEPLRLPVRWKGKIETVVTVPVNTKDDLSPAYTPGVVIPCLETVITQADLTNVLKLAGKTRARMRVVTSGARLINIIPRAFDRRGGGRRLPRLWFRRRGPAVAAAVVQAEEAGGCRGCGSGGGGLRLPRLWFRRRGRRAIVQARTLHLPQSP